MRLEEERYLGTTVRCYAGRPRTLVHVLDEAVRAHPDKISVRAEEGDITNREFAGLVEGAAERLAEAGVSGSDRLATCLRTGLESAVAFFACARLGAVLVALNTRLRPAQWASQLAHSKPRLVLSHPEWIGGVKAAAADAMVDEVYEAGAEGPGPGGSLLAEPRPFSLGLAPDAPDEDEPFAIVYTSGTTGAPKGVLVTHRAAIHAALTYVEALGLGPADRSLVVLPMFYVSGIVDHLIPHMLTGGTSILVEGFRAAHVSRRLASERATFFMGVPAMLGLLIRESEALFSERSLPDLRVLAYGGAPMPAAWVAGLRQRFERARLCEVYGLTETHSPATILFDGVRPGSVGLPIPCMDVCVVDDGGAECAPGLSGELLVRGPNVTPGYFEAPEATADAFRDGWFRTGDLARLDEDGYVYLLDRKKDMIERGGFKVYGIELEYVLLRHPDLVEAAVVGVPSEIAGEDVVAHVVVRPGAGIRPADIRHWLAGTVADYQVPRHVRFRKALPRNPTGKVDKRALRHEELQRRAATIRRHG